MSPASNERSGAAPLRTALVADAARAADLAAAARRVPELEIVGQAGMPQGAALSDVPWHDDRRVLVTMPELDVVLLAGTTRADNEMAGVACEHGVHVWRVAPLARGFAPAAECIRLARGFEGVYRVASWWEHVVDNGWSELDWPEQFTPHYSELRVSAAGPAAETWRGTLADAAGGVLADCGYDLLEALVATRGLPETVAAATATYYDAGRETEDTALAILRYADGGTALVRATWDCPPWFASVSHADGPVTVSIANGTLALTGAGAADDERALPADWWSADLRRFVDYIRSDARDRALTPLERHLAVTALIETIYLAARTMHPETPRKLYEVQGWPLPNA